MLVLNIFRPDLFDHRTLDLTFFKNKIIYIHLESGFLQLLLSDIKNLIILYNLLNNLFKIFCWE